MGLMLSILVVCVGVIEALSCYEHFQYGVLHCATSIYENARRRSSVFLNYTSRRLKLLSEDSIAEDDEGNSNRGLALVAEPIDDVEPKKIKKAKSLEKQEKIDIVKKLLEKPKRPKTLRSISMPALIVTERDVELSKIINELANEPVEEVNVEIDIEDPETILKEFDNLFDESEDKKFYPKEKQRAENSMENCGLGVKDNKDLASDKRTKGNLILETIENKDLMEDKSVYHKANDLSRKTKIISGLDKSMSIDFDKVSPTWAFENSTKPTVKPTKEIIPPTKSTTEILEEDVSDKTFDELFGDLEEESPDELNSKYKELEEMIIGALDDETVTHLGKEYISSEIAKYVEGSKPELEKQETVESFVDVGNNQSKVLDEFAERVVDFCLEEMKGLVLASGEPQLKISSRKPFEIHGFDFSVNDVINAGNRPRIGLRGDNDKDISLKCQEPPIKDLPVERQLDDVGGNKMKTSEEKWEKEEEKSKDLENLEKSDDSTSTGSTITLLSVSSEEPIKPSVEILGFDSVSIVDNQVSVEDPAKTLEAARGALECKDRKKVLEPYQDTAKEIISMPWKVEEKDKEVEETLQDANDFASIRETSKSLIEEPPKMLTHETLLAIDYKDRKKASEPCQNAGCEIIAMEWKVEEKPKDMRVKEKFEKEKEVEGKFSVMNDVKLKEKVKETKQVEEKVSEVQETLEAKEFKIEEKNKEIEETLLPADDSALITETSKNLIAEPAKMFTHETLLAIEYKDRKKASDPYQNTGSEIIAMKWKAEENDKEVEEKPKDIKEVKVEEKFEEEKEVEEKPRDVGEIKEKLKETKELEIEEKFKDTNEVKAKDKKIKELETEKKKAENERLQKTELENFENLEKIPQFKAENLEDKIEISQTEDSTNDKMATLELPKESDLLSQKTYLEKEEEKGASEKQEVVSLATVEPSKVLAIKFESPLALEYKNRDRDSEVDEAKVDKVIVMEWKEVKPEESGESESCRIKDEKKSKESEESSGEVGGSGPNAEVKTITPEVIRGGECKPEELKLAVGKDFSKKLESKEASGLNAEVEESKPEALPPEGSTSAEFPPLEIKRVDNFSVDSERKLRITDEGTEGSDGAGKTPQSAPPSDGSDTSGTSGEILRPTDSKKKHLCDSKPTSGEQDISAIDVTNPQGNSPTPRDNKEQRKSLTLKEGKQAKSAPEAFWLIFSGEYTKAMSKDWHSGHFSCWQCDEALTGQRYVLRDDHPYCIKCYESVFANVCEECNKIIGIDSKDLSYKDKHWHEACFLCNKCRVSLVDKQFGSKADKIYCGNCYDAQFASRCDGCGEIFRAGTKKMEYKTRQWHEKCFCCCVCKTPIGTKSFIPREQEIYCATCYEEKFATRCVKCNKIITSGGVTYKNEPWHRECFTCTNCNTSLAGQRFTSRDEKPYCADCFGELFAKRCTACSRPITGIGGTRFISFEDRHWHNDCFICASCKTSLVGRGFITDGDDIICPECAKQKLM